MQVVLCGRPLLLDNLRQLSICNFEEVSEERYELGPFEVDDTSAFIDFLSRHYAGRAEGKIPVDAIRQIHQTTAGNAGKIYSRVAEILESENPDAVLSDILSSAGGVDKNIFSGKGLAFFEEGVIKEAVEY